jgi:hypothetical protein
MCMPVDSIVIATASCKDTTSMLPTVQRCAQPSHPTGGAGVDRLYRLILTGCCRYHTGGQRYFISLHQGFYRLLSVMKVVCLAKKKLDFDNTVMTGRRMS